MKKHTLNILLIIVSLGLFSLNFSAVFAQSMLVQILGGGYRLDGASLIDFPAQTASVSDVTTSEISMRDVTDPKPYLLITDENGGKTFNIQISATGALKNELDNEIPLTEFLVKNKSGTGNDVDAIHGRSDGLVLNTDLNDYFQDPPTNSIPNDLSVTRVLATGTGEQPGEWKIYPGFRIDIPTATAIGTYETSIIFTII